jgi:hypothetical protein
VDQFELQGFFDVIGNVWQHTETDILPFKGFKVHAIYDDFSGAVISVFVAPFYAFVCVLQFQPSTRVTI